MKPETKFRNNYVIPFLHSLHQCDVTSVQQLSRSGDPDLYICLRGKFIAMEIKASEGSKPRKLQVWKLEKIKKAQGISLVVYPENWEDTKTFLLELCSSNSA
jgi:hypothetical protein